MKNNSKITILIASLILISWISFLFIEKDTTNWNEITSLGQIHEANAKANTKNTQTQQQNNSHTKLIEQAKLIQQKNKEKDDEKDNSTEREAKKEIKEDLKDNIKNNESNKQEITQPIIIPDTYNIENMDFFSQAPYGNRNQPYQDACEEASLLIWQYYLNNTSKTKAEYNKDLLAMVDLEMKMLWYFESTTIMEMKQIINTRDKSIKAKIIEHPTIRDLEREISQNNVVVAPFYWKGLNNPHYALWGPNYHFLVIKGYDKDNFITHDVWTLRWANRHYTKKIIMDNLHDRNRIDVRKWAARVLVMYK